jgi:hypothetical protein
MGSAVCIAVHANFAWIWCTLTFRICILGSCKIHKSRGIVTTAMFIRFVAKINAGTTICVFTLFGMLISAVTFSITPISNVHAFSTALLSITDIRNHKFRMSSSGITSTKVTLFIRICIGFFICNTQTAFNILCLHVVQGTCYTLVHFQRSFISTFSGREYTAR